MSNIFQDIKDRVDLKDLVRYYDLDVERGRFPCCPFHNERTLPLKSMKIITTVLATVRTETTLTSLRNYTGYRILKLQKRSVTISGYGCLIRKLSLRSIHTKKKMNDIYRWLKNMG